MKVLSLLQPWANALFTVHPDNPGKAVKSWETRSWKPGEENLKIIRNEGLLIHASLGWKTDKTALLQTWPFKDFLNGQTFQKGKIIGIVNVGRIMTTGEWLSDNITENMQPGRDCAGVEYSFGNYGPKRYAWEFTSFKLFKEPTPAKGSLNLWDFNEKRLNTTEVK